MKLKFWLAISIISALIVFTPVIAEEVQVAQCNDDGVCVISEAMLAKIKAALEYWYNKAQTCKGV